jgi:hexosaminidase
MYKRLAIVSQKLGYYGPRHRLITDEMLERMSGDPNPEALKVLAAVVQPPRMYERQQLRSDFTVLNRLDDAVSPESDTAREFDGIAQRISSLTATAQDWQQARTWLELWRDNDAKLQPMLKRSFLTQDLAPVSSTLRRVAEIGLQALDDLHEHRSVDADSKKQSIEYLESSAKPQAVLLLMPASSVEKLVKACKTE